MPLNDYIILNAAPMKKPYRISDSHGLYLEISSSGSRLWYFRFRFNGKQNRISLGHYPQTTLVDARRKRDAARRLLASGESPAEHRKSERATASKARKFQHIALGWHTSCLNLWSDVYANKILVCLQRYVFPYIGDTNIAKIETFHLAEVIRNIDNKGVHDVAIRTRQYLTKIMRYAIQKGIIYYNPAFDLEGVIPPANTRHYPALPLNHLPALLTNIDNYNGKELTRLALKLNIHVFLRASELQFARWSEFDFKMRIWTIPAEREAIPGVRFSERGSKMKEEHLVPLSDQVMELLTCIKHISKESEFVLPGIRDKHKPMSENTINKALRTLGYNTKLDVCAHGFRTMACSALNESEKWSKDAIERQMSHKDRNTVRAAYMHKAEFLEAHIEMMQWWSDYLSLNQKEYIAPYIYARRSDVA
ncbi:tyrosine-type recombinase/integrase [Escherichia coli]|uniref:tyrosine-type recombinase/integrase n=3 Tax=Escherichia coli TaxID=562 RepID=UPI003B9D88CA